MASLNKSTTTLKAITAVAADAQSLSSAKDVSGVSDASVFVNYAPDHASAKVGAGTKFTLQASEAASGNDNWRDMFSFHSGIGAPATHAVDGTVNAGDQTILESSTGSLVVEDMVFFKNGTLANSEWATVVKVTANTSFVLQDPLTRAQTGATWFGGAMHWTFPLNVSSFLRIRVACNNNVGTTNRAINWSSSCSTADSLS